MTENSDIDCLPPLREVIRQHDLRAEKKLGQNFLLDLNLTQKIARVAGDLTGVHVIEIGPGPGGLTRALLKTGAASVTAVEYDPRAVCALQSLKESSSGRLRIVSADALETDVTAICPAPRAIVANLPYNIATPLLIGWLEQLRLDPLVFNVMALMFQKEVAQRLTAPPGTKAYGRLSVIAQWLCDVRAAFDIPPSAFTPPPKVVSSVVFFKPKQPGADMPSFDVMEQVTEAAFGQRRKMIRSSLKKYEAALLRCGLDDTQRAENLSVHDYAAICRAFVNN